MKPKKQIQGYCSTVLDLRKDAVTLKQLDDLEELVDVPIERGGVHFTDWERTFIKSARQAFDALLSFSQPQRDKVADIWRTTAWRASSRAGR